MSNSINKVIISGFLGNDAEVMGTAGKVTRASIALAESYKDKDGVYQNNVEWIDLVCFNKLGELFVKHAKKGVYMNIEGKLKVSNYTDKDGIKQHRVQVEVEKFDVLKIQKADKVQK